MPIAATTAVEIKGLTPGTIIEPEPVLVEADGQFADAWRDLILPVLSASRPAIINRQVPVVPAEPALVDLRPRPARLEALSDLFEPPSFFASS